MKGAQNGKKQGLMRSIILGYEVLFLIFFALRGLIPSDFHFGNDLLRMASGISVLLVLVLTYIEFGEKANRSSTVMLLSLNFMALVFILWWWREYLLDRFVLFLHSSGSKKTSGLWDSTVDASFTRLAMDKRIQYAWIFRLCVGCVLVCVGYYDHIEIE